MMLSSPASYTPAQLLLARTPPTLATAAASTSAAAPPRPAGSSFPHRRAAPTPLAVAPLTIHPTFQKNARNPGTVKVIIESSRNVFYVHRDVMAFGSSFFEAILAGGWLESSSDAASSLLDTQQTGVVVNATPAFLSNAARHRVQTPPGNDNDAITDWTAANLTNSLSTASPSVLDNGPSSFSASQDTDTATQRSTFADDIKELGITVDPPAPEGEQETVGEQDAYEDISKKIEARITLRDEKAAAFQDLLFFLYPHLDCVIHWNNVAELMAMSSKFDIPLLSRHCVNFLMASAAGKPIMALKIADDHSLVDLYREASRYLLDSWTFLEEAELRILSHVTLLKLEKRRNWFLERLLQLGLVNVGKDYVCTPTCPDSSHCSRILEDKWKAAWSATFRYGSPTPSSVYRSLRMLEPSVLSPALHLPLTSCQNHAKAWVQDLFDRLFSLGPMTTRTASRAPFSDPTSNKKYFLYIDWKAPAV